MPIDFLTDHNVAVAVGQFLVERGHDVVRVADQMEPNTPDPIVARAAIEAERVLISWDKDFNHQRFMQPRFADLGPVEIQDSHGDLVLIQAPKREQWMTRFVLTDAQWSRIEPHCLGKATDPGRTGGDARRFFEAVLWIARTGSPWRDLPEVFGRWNTVFKRFRHWVKADAFKRIFDALSGDPDLEFAMIDGSIVKVHRHGQGAKGGLRARP